MAVPFWSGSLSLCCSAAHMGAALRHAGPPGRARATTPGTPSPNDLCTPTASCATGRASPSPARLPLFVVELPGACPCLSPAHCRSALGRRFAGGEGRRQHRFGVARPLVELCLGGILQRGRE